MDCIAHGVAKNQTRLSDFHVQKEWSSWNKAKTMFSYGSLWWESKAWWCKKQYCIGTWNVRPVNQGTLDMVKQEIARVNINILEISKLKWMRMGEFNSDDYCIYSEKAMAPNSSTLAWKIPWVEEPGRLQSMGSLRVGYDWATSLSLFPFMHWRRKWQPTPVFLPGESQGWESLVGCRLWGHTELDTTEVI